MYACIAGFEREVPKNSPRVISVPNNLFLWRFLSQANHSQTRHIYVELDHRSSCDNFMIACEQSVIPILTDTHNRTGKNENVYSWLVSAKDLG